MKRTTFIYARQKKKAECYLVWLQPNIGCIGWLKFLAIPHKISVNECEKNVRVDLGYIYILVTKQITNMESTNTEERL